MDIEEIGKQIVDSAVKVHRALGPGLLESAYQYYLAYELRKRGLKVETEVLQPVFYDGQKIDVGYRLDAGGTARDYREQGRGDDFACSSGAVVDLFTFAKVFARLFA